MVPNLIWICKSHGYVHFSRFRQEIPFLGQHWPQNSRLYDYSEIWFLDLCDYAEFNDDVHFSVLDQKYPFWAKLVQKIKIVSLSQNLVSRLIWICKVQWWCSPFFVFYWEYPFWANLVKKLKFVCLKRNLVPTITVIIFWDFLMFYQIFLSPQVKRCEIISYKHAMYQFPHELSNDLRLRILGN